MLAKGQATQRVGNSGIVGSQVVSFLGQFEGFFRVMQTCEIQEGHFSHDLGVLGILFERPLVRAYRLFESSIALLDGRQPAEGYWIIRLLGQLLFEISGRGWIGGL